MRVLCSYIFRAALLLMAAQFGSVIADNILELRRLDALKHRTEQEVAALEKQNEILRHQAMALDDDTYYVELTLRKRMKWVLPGEMPIEFRPGRSPQVSTHLARHADSSRRTPDGAETKRDGVASVAGAAGAAGGPLMAIRNLASGNRASTE